MPRKKHQPGSTGGVSFEELIRADPKAAMKLLEQIQQYVVIPHEAQKPVVDSKARFKVMNCGRRFGKTKIAAKLFTAKARQENQMLWWVAPTYKVVKRGYAEVLRQLPDGVLAHPAPPETNFDAGRAIILRFKNGTRMEFYSAERPEGMLGEGVDYVVLDEAAIMPGRIWNQVVSPTLMDREGGALMISTPRGRNWFYKAWMMGQKGTSHQRGWESWTFTSYDNPHLPEGEVDRMREQMPRLEFEQEVLAKFLASGSTVFMVPESSVQTEEVMSTGLLESTSPTGQHIVLGIDLAKTNDWTVIYGARENDRKNVYFERLQQVSWPEQKRRIQRAVRTLMREGASGVTLLVDSTGVGDPVVEDLEEMGYDIVGINFTTTKNNMVKLLAKDLEERRTYVLDTGLDEFLSYTMTMSEAGRMKYSAPEGEHDDIVSAKMLCNWGLEHYGAVNVRTISADDPAPTDAGDDQFVDTEVEGEWDDLLDPDDPTDDPEVAMQEVGLAPGMPSHHELLIRGWAGFE